MKSFLSLLISFAFYNFTSAQAWTNQASAISGSLNTVSCIDSDHACTGGSSFPNLGFTLNGSTWNAASTSCTNSVVSAQCITQHTFVATSDYTYGGSFLKSSDRGSTFTCIAYPQESGAYATCNFHPRQIVFLDSMNGYVCGQYSGVSGGGTSDNFGQILKTVNGGQSWQPSLTPHYNQPGIPNQPNIQSVNNLYFLSTQNGFAVGNNDSLYKTNDGGNSWINFYLFTNGQNPNYIYFQNASLGWAACANGVLLSTNDGGNAWSRNNFPPTDNYTKIQFTDSLHGWLLGSTTVYKTCDGGITWNVSQNLAVQLHDMSMLDNNLGYAVGDNASIFKYTCTASITNLSQSICANQTYIVGNQTFNSGGTYDVHLQGANCGCDSIVHLSLTVHSLPAPAVTYTNGTYSTGIFAHYQWLYNGVRLTADTLQFISPSFIGDYSVVVADVNGCIDTSASVIFTSVSNLNGDIKIRAYPNPTKNRVHLSLPESSEITGYSVQLTDALGRILMTSSVTKKDFDLDLCHLSSSGILYLFVLTPSKEIVFSDKITFE